MSAIIDRAFCDAYNEAAQLYDNDKLEECITKAKEILAEGACPRTLRIRTIILLGNTLGDLAEASECYVEAHTLWRIVRRWNPAGEDEKMDTAMAELKQELDDLKEALEEEQRKKRDDCEDCNAVREARARAGRS
ncbi:hypothetical protein CBER1_02329 [Cercospora berteroae]|uniref:Uncharacterized protein n=1 Tax=Cercospora berteroae TaxID=357750 RepID=A0A2S6CM42_9PEZI|nr:hypothetical protein CBER1_02329 [Cercospora berteroae]